MHTLIGAVDDIVDPFDVPVYMHEAEFDFLKIPLKMADKFKQYGLPIITIILKVKRR